MFHKRHYEQLAILLMELRRQGFIKPADYKQAVHFTAGVLAADNSFFDEGKWEKVCGVGED